MPQFDQQSTAHALWYVGPNEAELRAEPLAPAPSGSVRMRALFSGVSRGTEALIQAGRVPREEFARMRAPLMQGAFPFPVKYGYAMVGRICSDEAEEDGRLAFVLHPHQDRFNIGRDQIHLLPEGVSPERGVLAANMETALNAVWDAAAAPADRIAIVGGGVVGLLIAYLCGRLPGTEVTLVDIDPARAAIARAFGVAFASPDRAPRDCDVVFHASAQAAGLASAIAAAGNEAVIAELSWYGAGDTAVPLGGAFHSKRLRLVSSQVGQIAPSHRSRWSHARRLAAALALLTDPVLDALLAPPIAFGELPTRLPVVFAPGSGVLCQLVRY